MKEYSPSRANAPLLELATRAIFTNDAFDLLPSCVGQYDVAQALVAVAAFKDVGELSAGLRDVDHRT